MKRSIVFLTVLSVALFTPSCKGRTNKLPVSANTAEVTHEDTTSIFDRLSSSGSPHMFSAQRLTSPEAMEKAFDSSPDDYFHETTPIEETFFFPRKGLRVDSLVRAVQLRYNYATVLNRIVHGYEFFERCTSGIEEEDMTYQDTLDIIKESQPKISLSLLRRALPDDRAFRNAKKLLTAYRNFDGDNSDGCALALAIDDYSNGYYELPEIVSEKEIDEVREGFWKWYDKRLVEPEIDKMVKTHLKDSKEAISDDARERFKTVVMGETDMDRRAVLALELAQIDEWEGTILLGDLIESGIYTKYLLEVWLSWRTRAQMNYSPSSFAMIPNNYYDRLRVKCLNTFLSKLQGEKNNGNPEFDETKYIRCLMENMILIQIVHRQGSIPGNDSFATSMHLAYDMFIDPRLLEEKE